MPARKLPYFRVIYMDKDAGTFNVSEIMTDDRDVNDRTVELQQAGRNVSISTTEPQKDISRVPSTDSVIRSNTGRYIYDPRLWW